MTARLHASPPVHFALLRRAVWLSLPELVEGIQQNPDALPATAAALAAMGPDAEAARPALLESLAALAKKFSSTKPVTITVRLLLLSIPSPNSLLLVISSRKIAP